MAIRCWDLGGAWDWQCLFERYEPMRQQGCVGKDGDGAWGGLGAKAVVAIVSDDGVFFEFGDFFP